MESSEEDDLTFFHPGSVLIVDVVEVPSLERWQVETQGLGVDFQPDPAFELTPGRHRLRATVLVGANAKLPGGKRLAARGPLSVTIDFELSAAARDRFAMEEDIDESELAHLRRTKWVVQVEVPREDGDLLPTALGVGLAAAGQGVIHHRGLDGSAYGASAAAMMANLVRQCEEVDAEHVEPGAVDSDRRIEYSYPDSKIPVLVRVTVTMAKRGFDTELDPEELTSFLNRITDSGRLEIDALEQPERAAKWTGIYAARIHIWLEGCLQPERPVHGPEWNDFVQQVERILTEPMTR